MSRLHRRCRSSTNTSWRTNPDQQHTSPPMSPPSSRPSSAPGVDRQPIDGSTGTTTTPSTPSSSPALTGSSCVSAHDQWDDGSVDAIGPEVGYPVDAGAACGRDESYLDLEGPLPTDSSSPGPDRGRKIITSASISELATARHALLRPVIPVGLSVGGTGTYSIKIFNSRGVQ
jgi:hypothetical protein